MSTTINPAFARTDADGFAATGRTLHDLRGFRFVEGDGGNAPAVTTTTTTPPAGVPALSDAEAQQILAQSIATGTPPEQNAPWTKDNFDPERAQKLVENLRGDITAEKTKRDQAIKDAVAQAQKDWTKSLAKVLGGEPEAETDPVKLAAQIAEKDTALTAAQSAAKAGAISTAVAILAPGLGASAKLLLNNEQFKTSVASVEPTDEAAITAAISTALQANAALKATPPRSGSGEHSGATVQNLEAQLAVATEKKDFTETIRLKQAISAARRGQ